MHHITYLRNRMMPFDYHRAHGWSHSHHLQAATSHLTDLMARSDTSRYSLWGFLLTCCDDTSTYLKQAIFLVLYTNVIFDEEL